MNVLNPENSFKFCGVAGMLLGGPLALWLTLYRGLSPWIEVILVVVAVGMLLATPLAVKIATGRDGFVFYRDVIGIFIGVTLTLRRLHQPILSYLDVTIAGAGIFHACGRIGCLLAGCCYGRPCRLGLRYRHAHAEMGFPLDLVGVRLFPVQLLECLWILCLVGLISVLIVRQSLPGLALAVYVTGYAVGRFVFEFTRGDAERPYLAGFSHAQWISWLLTLGVSLAGFIGVLPRLNVLLYAAPLLAVMMLLVRLCRLWATAGRFELLHPRHVLEMAGLLRRLSAPLRYKPVLSIAPSGQQPIEVATTFLGLHLSAERTQHRGRDIHIYSLSCEGKLLSPRCAHLLARLISRLQHNSARFEVRHGGQGVVHVLFAA